MPATCVSLNLVETLCCIKREKENLDRIQDLIIIIHKKTWISTFLNERVENMGIKLYNTVPNHIQELDSENFKKGLKSPSCYNFHSIQCKNIYHVICG